MGPKGSHALTLSHLPWAPVTALPPHMWLHPVSYTTPPFPHFRPSPHPVGAYSSRKPCLTA